MEGAPLLPRPPGVRAEGSRWWPGASCPWGGLGGESWSAPGLGGRAGAAGFGAGCWEAGAAPRSSRLSERKRCGVSAGALEPAWRFLPSGVSATPRPAGRLQRRAEARAPNSGARGAHASSQACQPRTGRASGPPPAPMARRPGLTFSETGVSTGKIRAPRLTARGSPFPSTALAVRGTLLSHGVWSPYNRLFGGSQAPPGGLA